MIRKINGVNVRNFSYDGAAVGLSGTLTQTKMISIPIPANTFKAGDLINVEAFFTKLGTAGIYTYRYYWNTTDSITGAVQIGVRSIGSTAEFTTASRRLSVRTANGAGATPEVGTEVIAFNGNFATEYQSNAVSNLALDWTVDSFLMTSMTLGNVGDTVVQYSFKVWTY